MGAEEGRMAAQKVALEAAQPQTAALMAHFLGGTPGSHAQYWANAGEARDELVAKKARLDALNLAKSWREWRSQVFYFSGSLGVVAAGSTTPEFDFHGNRVQDCTGPAHALQSLTVGVVECGNRFAYALGWEKDHDRAETVVSSLLTQPQERIPNLLVQFCFLQLQNVFFSDSWWEALAGSSKAVLTQHASVLIEGKSPEFSRASFVDWKMVPPCEASA